MRHHTSAIPRAPIPLIAVASIGLLLATAWVFGPAWVNMIDPPTDVATDKVYLLLAIVIASTASFYVWINSTWLEAPQKIASFCILASLLFSAATLVLDRSNFTSEMSWMTGATASVLAIASAIAYLNYWHVGRADRRASFAALFWMALSIVLLAASADELFMVHERLGRIAESVLQTPTGKVPSGESEIEGQDIITLLYGIVGFVAALAGGLLLRRFIFRGSTRFYAMFVAAATVYLASVLLDTFNSSLAALNPTIELRFIANAIEEVLELIAASLFAGSFAVALIDHAGSGVIAALMARLMRFPLSPFASVFGYFAAFIAIAVLFVPYLTGRYSQEFLPSSRSFTPSVLATRWEEPRLNPDGITYANGWLYVANDKTASVIRMQQGSVGEVLTHDGGGLQSPESLAVAPDHTVFVSDDNTKSVYSINGETLRLVLDRKDGLQAPKGLYVDSAGTLYVADPVASKIFRMDGDRATVLIDLHNEAAPEELTIDGQGIMYFTQEQPPRVYRVRPGSSGAEILIDETAGIVPEALAISGNVIAVSDSKTPSIARWRNNGEKLPSIQLKQTLRGVIEGLTIDERGNYYLGIRRGARSVILKVSEEQ